MKHLMTKIAIIIATMPLTAISAKASVSVMLSLSGKAIQLAPLWMVMGCSDGLTGRPSNTISQSLSTVTMYIWVTFKVLNVPLHRVPLYVVRPSFFDWMVIEVLPVASRAAFKASRSAST
ncbi:MAG: hypothetical protein IIT37_11590 [Bacteroidales bacterium]|nr:hypothetical protein [Bacteroidales bacterium]